ncbi:MAG: UDP-N-acetylmuramoyl-tripeptide--D-alanyl-D-alanine ligase [Ignavibacteria bacterium]|nr:UDP-N-acetylmuramoyl-tripeptide--D-alanyl-D-alanine ligase [Ignavibacteria bacterium]
MGIGLSDLEKLKNSGIINAGCLENTNFGGVSIDSRKCRSNELFFAIQGERFDGHDFVKSLFKKGVKCAVVSELWYRKLKVTEKRSFKKKSLVLVRDTVASLGELASGYRDRFIIPVLAVGGSNGKTSAKDFIANVLMQKYNVLRTEGNLNNQLGVPLTLFRLNKRHEIAVIEVGTNHFGEVDLLCRMVKPQFGLITNIGKEHLEFLKDLRGAAKAEGELAEYLKEVHGTLFLNTDDKFLKKYKGSKDIKKFTYGFRGNTEVKGVVKKFNGFYPQIQIKYNNKIINTQLNTIGYQSCQAALSAAAVGFFFEVPVRSINKAVTRYKIESKKRNQLKSINGVWVIDDTYNSNPDSVKAALDNLKAFKTKGKKFVVLADMLELGKQSTKEHKDIGRIIKSMKFDNLFTYGKDSFSTHTGAKGTKNNFHFSDKYSMSILLRTMISKGDIVLFKGSRGMEMEEVIERTFGSY